MREEENKVSDYADIRTLYVLIGMGPSGQEDTSVTLAPPPFRTPGSSLAVPCLLGLAFPSLGPHRSVRLAHAVGVERNPRLLSCWPTQHLAPVRRRTTAQYTTYVCTVRCFSKLTRPLAGLRLARRRICPGPWETGFLSLFPSQHKQAQLTQVSLGGCRK